MLEVTELPLIRMELDMWSQLALGGCSISLLTLGSVDGG
jgi:hypothetical protein